LARSPLPLRSALQGRPTRQRSAIHPDRRNPTGLSPSLAISDVPVRLGNADQVSRSTKSQLHGDESPADSTLDGTRFVRHYSGSPSWFLLLRIVICLSSPGTLLPSDATVRNLFSSTRRKFRRFDFGRQTTARISHILLGTELDRRSVLRRPSTGCDRRSFVVAKRRLPVDCWAVRTAVVVSFAFSIFDVLWFACRGGSASSLQSWGESLDRCVRSRLAGHFDGAAAAIVNKQRRAYYHYVLSGSCDRDLFRCPLVVFRKRSRTADNPAKGRRCVL